MRNLAAGPRNDGPLATERRESLHSDLVMHLASTIVSPKAAVNIYTDKAEYYAGEVIEVKLVFSVPAALKHNGVKVKCHIQHVACCKGGNRLLHFREEPFLERMELVPAGILASGTHMCTLRWPLHSDCPSSLFYQDRSSKVLINYRIKAEIVLPGVFTSNLRAVAAIPVHARVRPSVPVIAVHTLPVSTCCTNAGSLAIYAVLPKDLYVAGEDIVFTLALDATALRIPVKGVAVVLKCQRILRTSELQAGLVSKSIISRQSVSGIAAGTKGERHIALHIPPYALPSVTTNILSYSYYVRVSAVFGRCAKEKFRMNLDIVKPARSVSRVAARAEEVAVSETSNNKDMLNTP